MSFHYSQSLIKLFICVLLTQFCLIESNVIQKERQSDEKHIKISSTDQRLDNKIIKTIEQQLKAQSGEPMNVKLYGYASMIDPRTYVSPYQSMANNYHQFNNYQKLYNDLKPSESGIVEQVEQLQSGLAIGRPSQYNMATDEEALNVIKTYIKKYDLKRYFLKKILGDAYDKEEGHDEGFFGNKHLRRHGTTGMAAKVLGELIGIKIRKSIEHFGDTVSDYAKELTTNGFVSIGNTFSKLFRFS